MVILRLPSFCFFFCSPLTLHIFPYRFISLWLLNLFPFSTRTVMTQKKMPTPVHVSQWLVFPSLSTPPLLMSVVPNDFCICLAQIFWKARICVYFKAWKMQCVSPLECELLNSCVFMTTVEREALAMIPSWPLGWHRISLSLQARVCVKNEWPTLSGCVFS